MYGTRKVARSWQRGIENGIKEAGMVVGKMKCSCESPCWKLVGAVHCDDILQSAVGHENKFWERDQLVRVKSSCRTEQ